MQNTKGKRELIIEAAIKIFAKEGFHKAKVGDIADMAGVGKGTIYEYFESKKHLFEEMIRYSLEIYVEAIDGVLHKNGTIEQKLKGFILLAQDLAQKHVNIAKIFSQETGAVSENIMKIMIHRQKYIVERIRELLQQGVDHGEFRQVNLEIAALNFIGGVKHMIMYNYFVRKRSVMENETDQFLHIFMNGLKK